MFPLFNVFLILFVSNRDLVVENFKEEHLRNILRFCEKSDDLVKSGHFEFDLIVFDESDTHLEEIQFSLQ